MLDDMPVLVANFDWSSKLVSRLHCNFDSLFFTQLNFFFMDFFILVFTKSYVRDIATFVTMADLNINATIIMTVEHISLLTMHWVSRHMDSYLSLTERFLNFGCQRLHKLFEVATAAKEQGIADYAAGKLDAYKKHAWMIRSCLKSGE